MGETDRARVEEALELRDRLYRTALFLSSGDRERARDLLQETLLAFFSNRTVFAGRSTLYTYLYRILLNTHYRFLRKTRPVRTPATLNTVTGTPVSGETGPLEELMKKDRQAAVRKAILSLPTIHQVVILLRYIDGLSYEEIAQSAGIPLGTVRSRLSAGKETLARILKRENFFP